MSQEVVTIRLSGSGGYKYITNNGTTNNTGKVEVEKGSLVELSTTAGDPNTKKFSFFTVNKSYTNGGTIVSNKNPYRFIAEESKTFYINYVNIDEGLTANITVTASEGGYITGMGYGHTYVLGEEFSFTAVANENHSFKNWTDANGNVVCEEANFTGVIQAKEVAYTANFEPTTGIGKLKVENGKAKVIYDLTGRRVDAITAPGIYIVNGKKTLVK